MSGGAPGDVDARHVAAVSAVSGLLALASFPGWDFLVAPGQATAFGVCALVSVLTGIAAILLLVLRLLDEWGLRASDRRPEARDGRWSLVAGPLTVCALFGLGLGVHHLHGLGAALRVGVFVVITAAVAAGLLVHGVGRRDDRGAVLPRSERVAPGGKELGFLATLAAVVVCSVLFLVGLDQDPVHAPGWVWVTIASGLCGGAAVVAALVMGLDLLHDGRVDARPGRRPEAPRAQHRLLERFITGHPGARVAWTRGGEEAVREHDGQEAAVHVSAGGGLSLWVRVEAEQARELDLTPANLPARLRAELRLAGPAAPDALADVLPSERVDRALRLLFGSFQARRVWLERGLLHVQTGFQADVVAPTWVETLLDALIGLASLLDEMRVVVRSAARSAGAVRCPYCHEVADQGSPVTCPACATVHHRECWDEAGGCTLLGCRGRPARGRARA